MGKSNRFSVLHPEQIPRAISRYEKEAHRVMSVLDTDLDGKSWLVAGMCTFADLAFPP